MLDSARSTSHSPGSNTIRTDQSWQSLSAALTHLRAGHWEHALDLVQKFPQEIAWRPSLLALAYHGLKRVEEARHELAKADRAWLSLTGFLSAPEESGTPIGPGPGGSSLSRPTCSAARPRRSSKATDPGEDPRFAVYQDRFATRLKHLDKATADYDFA